METEEESRVSLDDEFSDNSSVPDSLSDSSDAKSATVKKARARERIAKRREGEKRAIQKLRAGKKSLFAKLFGFRRPLVGGETWESVGTSWFLPDMAHTVWRMVSFCVIIGVYTYLALVQSLSFQYYTTDVLLCVLVSVSVLLLPNIAIHIAGPHEDELDGEGIRWVWTMVTVIYQITVTNVLFISLAYWIFFDLSRSASSQGGALAPSLQRILHVSCLLTMGGELVIGCIELRAAYALTGLMTLIVYLWAVVGGHHKDTGKWLYSYLQQSSASDSLNAHLSVVILYICCALLVMAIGRIRKGCEAWLEKAQRTLF